MTDMFEAKVRRVGNSLGIIIPREIILGSNLSDGDIVRVALPVLDCGSRKRKLASFIGSEKGKPQFARDKGDRF